jgi:hypothetical protein
MAPRTTKAPQKPKLTLMEVDPTSYAVVMLQRDAKGRPTDVAYLSAHAVLLDEHQRFVGAHTALGVFTGVALVGPSDEITLAEGSENHVFTGRAEYLAWARKNLQ